MRQFDPQVRIDQLSQSARRAQEAGEAAMRELQVRRRGLAVATLVIVAFLVTLRIKIRRLSQTPD